MVSKFIENWDCVIKSGDHRLLNDLLSDDVVFYSPVVFSPQHGKMITYMYLVAASRVLANDHFRYISKINEGKRVIFEFETQIDDIYVNGVDIIDLSDDGRIKEMKVMVRPLQAVNKIHQLMGELLRKGSF